MNYKMIAGLSLLLSHSAVSAAPVTVSNSWTETYAVTAATAHLEVDNLWGNVRVRVGAPGEIAVSVSEHRQAPNQRLFERSLDVLGLDIVADSSTVSIIVGERDKRYRDRDHCRDCRVDYQFEISVPPNTSLQVGTVMDGKVEIDGVAGVVNASNVNGPIEIAGIRNCGDIDSVNGAIRMSFDSAPQQDCRIETINGDVTLQIPDHSGLVLAMDLMNGRMSTDLPVDALTLPVTVEQSEKDGRKNYRVQQMAGVRMGAGGPTYTITSMNGDLNIRNRTQ